MMRWFGALIECVFGAPFLVAGIVLVWFLLPWCAQMVVNPDDVIRLQHVLQGLGLPAEFGKQQLHYGMASAILAIVALGLLLVGLLTVLYHRIGEAFTLWPVAVIAFGVVGNLAWGYKFGFIDQQGIAAGFVPAVLTIAWQWSAERWARNFVFGSNS